MLNLLRQQLNDHLASTRKRNMPRSIFMLGEDDQDDSVLIGDPQVSLPPKPMPGMGILAKLGTKVKISVGNEAKKMKNFKLIFDFYAK